MMDCESRVQNDVQSNDTKEDVDTSKSSSDDLYSYMKRGEFTSEIFKIEVKNLPKHIGYDSFKKLLKKFSLKAIKIKLIGKPPKHAFVTFSCDEDREAALTQLNHYKWKNNQLEVKKANPVADPLVEKRKLNKLTDEKEPNIKKLKSIEELGDLGNAINDKICPLWKVPYDQQVLEKKQNISNFLIDVCKEIGKMSDNSEKESPRLFNWFLDVRKRYNSLCCPLDDVRKSPLICGYRNKCEFTVGNDKVVGFRLGLYKEGTMEVVTPPDGCPIISEQMRKALNSFQDFIKESHLDGFNPEFHSGHWRQLTVRTSKEDCMIIIAMHPQNLTDVQLEEEKNKIKNYYECHPEFGVNSVFIHVSNKRHEISNSNLQHLFGKTSIIETMTSNALKFRISPLSFFQINTRSAEICYQTIDELLGLTPETIVLDVCCGTGTIGLFLASKVKKVIGIELNEDGVSDARENAKINGISNINFIQGRAENVLDMKNIRKIIGGSNCNVVAVIDPPRAGLNNSVIRALRSVESLRSLVYVSCDPMMAKKNLIDLCRPASKSYKGDPFVPVKAIPVDMFPSTTHCELLLLYERLKEIKVEKSP